MIEEPRQHLIQYFKEMRDDANDEVRYLAEKLGKAIRRVDDINRILAELEEEDRQQKQNSEFSK